MGVAITDLPNVVATTINDLPENRYTMEHEYQHSEAAFVFGNATKRAGGLSIEDRVSLDRSGQARMRSPYEADVTKLESPLYSTSSPWVQGDTHAMWDAFELLATVDNPDNFIDLLKVKITEAKADLDDELNRQLFGVPQNSSDIKNFRGLFYHMLMANNGVATDGFNGQTIRYADGTTGTTIAGLDASALPKWRNYTLIRDHNPATPTFNQDFVKRARLANRKIQFSKNRLYTAPKSGLLNSAHRIYMSLEDEAELLDYMDLKNDVHKGMDDVAGAMPRMDIDSDHIKWLGHPVIPHELMAYDADDPNLKFAPIVCINWGAIAVYRHRNYWMLQSPEIRDNNAHSVIKLFWDFAIASVPRSRRQSGWVAHTVTSA